MRKDEKRENVVKYVLIKHFTVKKESALCLYKKEMINIIMEDIEAGVGVSTDENKVRNNAFLVKLAWNSTLNKRKIILWNIW